MVHVDIIILHHGGRSMLPYYLVGCIDICSKLHSTNSVYGCFTEEFSPTKKVKYHISSTIPKYMYMYTISFTTIFLLKENFKNFCQISKWLIYFVRIKIFLLYDGHLTCIILVLLK